MHQPRLTRLVVGIIACGYLAFASSLAATQRERHGPPAASQDEAIKSFSHSLLTQGQQIFRYDTFGDEDYWGGQLRLHEAIEGSRFGGVGAGVSPKTALAVGLKVDVDALPRALQNQLSAGAVDLSRGPAGSEQTREQDRTQPHYSIETTSGCRGWASWKRRML